MDHDHTAELIVRTGLFDADCYLESHPQAADAPLQHYLTGGAREGQASAPYLGPHHVSSNTVGHLEALARRFDEAGLTWPRYQALLLQSYADFAIVCHQRSGSHFLATALDSHPEIDCQGELLQLLQEPLKAYAPLPRPVRGRRGAILMYSQWGIAAALGIHPPLVLHLLRDPRNCAISVLRNLSRLERRGERHRPHAKRDDPSADPMTAFDVDPVDVAGWETGIKAAQQHFLDLMEGKPVVLAVGYEELSSDRDTEVLPVGISRGLLEFLGIEDVARLLRTVLRKTS